MALQAKINNPYSSNYEKGYIHIKALTFDRLTKTGSMLLHFWNDEETRRNKSKSPIGVLMLDFTGGLEYEKLYGKTDAEIYTELKKQVLKFSGEDLDLSQAEDVL